MTLQPRPVHKGLPASTHTVEMGQLADLNHRLAVRPERVTAAELELAGTVTSGHRGDPLRGSAIVVRVTWDGSPEFPNIHGHFTADGSSAATVVVDLHTAALRLLSRRLAARHLWGVGTVPPRVVGHRTIAEPRLLPHEQQRPTGP